MGGWFNKYDTLTFRDNEPGVLTLVTKHCLDKDAGLLSKALGGPMAWLRFGKDEEGDFYPCTSDKNHPWMPVSITEGKEQYSGIVFRSRGLTKANPFYDLVYGKEESITPYKKGLKSEKKMAWFQGSEWTPRSRRRLSRRTPDEQRRLMKRLDPNQW